MGPCVSHRGAHRPSISPDRNVLRQPPGVRCPEPHTSAGGSDGAGLTPSQAVGLFENAFANAPIGMALVDLDGRFLKVNQSVCEFLGYPEPELLRQSFQVLTHPDDLDADIHEVERLVAGEIDHYTMSKRYLRKDGDEVWASLSVSVVRDDRGDPVHFISQIVDISERRRLELALQHLADHDHLTELCNRRAFEPQLRRQIAQCRRRAAPPATLLLVDLNGFKLVNDTHGHGAGDELLSSIANTLRRRLRTSECIARIGGDEFAIILPDTAAAQASRVAASVAEEVARACVNVDGREVGVSASVGITCLTPTPRTSATRWPPPIEPCTTSSTASSVRPRPTDRGWHAAYPVGVPVSLILRRSVYRVAYRVLQVFWFVARPRKQGVKCLLTCRDRVLLVRHTYGSRAWDIPGGALKRKEPPLSAARREMREELGLGGVDWIEIGDLQGRVNHRRDIIHCFRAELCEPRLTIDRVELAALDWFARSALPEDLAPYVGPVIARAPAIEG
jgi:diguanylate cyclase (GGDEF)-like protein/PAS domain S-box-containing protein